MTPNDEVLEKQDRKCVICGRPLTEESVGADDKLGTYHIFGKGEERAAICNKCYVHTHEFQEYPNDPCRNMKPIKYRRCMPVGIILTILFGWIGMLYTNPRKSGSLLLFSAVCGILIGFISVILTLTVGVGVCIVVLWILLIVFVVLYYVQAVIMTVRETRRIDAIWDVFHTDDDKSLKEIVAEIQTEKSEN